MAINVFGYFFEIYYCLLLVIGVVAIYSSSFARVNIPSHRHLQQPLHVNLPLIISFACVLAAVGPFSLDVLLDIQAILRGKSEVRNSRGLAMRLLSVLNAAWPSLHALSYVRSISGLHVLCDLIAHKYIGQLVVLYSLLTVEGNKLPKLTIAIVSSILTLGVIIASVPAPTEADDASPVRFGIAVFFEFLAMIVLLYAHCCSGSPSQKGFANITVKMLLLYFMFLVTFIILQTCFEFGLSEIWVAMAVASNYSNVVAWTLPTVLPGRMYRQNIKQVTKLSEFRQSFMRYISHEIRTPLNVSSVGVAMLEEYLISRGLVKEEVEVKEILEQTKRGLTISTEILNDLLTFEKLNANAMVLEQSLQKPLDFVISTVSLFEFQAKDRNIKFILPQANNPIFDNCFIYIDTYKMSQVLRNLVSNALKFTSPGGKIEVIVELYCNQVQVPSRISPPSRRLLSSLSNSMIMPTMPIVSEWIRISVVDDGVGIAPQNIPKLFNEIIQFDANKLQQGKGTGLGLFITRGIVDLHGGTIRATSAGLGFGCTVIVDLPMVRSNANSGNESNLMSEKLALTEKTGVCGDASGTGLQFGARPMQTMESDMFLDDLERGGYGNQITPRNPSNRTDDDHSKATDEGASKIQIPVNNVSNSSAGKQRPSYIQLIPLSPIQPLSVDENGFLSDREGSSGSYVPPGTVRAGYSQGRASSAHTSGHHSYSHGQHHSMVSRLSVSQSNANVSAPRHTQLGTKELMTAMESGRIRPSERPPQPQRTTIDLRDCTVLLVDDSSMNLKMMKLMIKTFGATCLEASDGSYAVQMVTDCLNGTAPKIDIVIMDNHMETMSGPEACALMRRVGYANPIFGLTGDADVSSDQEYLEAGANFIFRKPLRIQEMVDQLTLCSL